MAEKELYVREAVAVGRKAMEQGVAGRSMSEVELEREVRKKIERVGR